MSATFMAILVSLGGIGATAVVVHTFTKKRREERAKAKETNG